ncbi:membrane protein FAM174A [Rhinatrema bivittatum]|uniref:membrane protein FAM174A n=1 Tax=Rhinatrema bivittatum TaxID=194408 RepID=UPI00112C81E8|nr:membrane protein FAM174A [Rhinatrema bivittatum]
MLGPRGRLRTLSPLLSLLLTLNAAAAAVQKVAADSSVGQPLPSLSPSSSPPINGSTSGKALPTRMAAKNAGVSSAVAPEKSKPQTQRALAVLVVVSAAVIVYFVIRTIRTRRRNKKTRRYGVLDTNIENMELTPLEQDDDDDDTTLFDANHPRR